MSDEAAPGPVRRRRFETTSLDEATELLRSRYSHFTPSYPRGRRSFDFWVSSEEIDTRRGVLGIERLRNAMCVDARVEPFPMLSMTMPLGGRLRYRCRREETGVGPMLLPTWDSFESSWDDLTMEVVNLDLDGVRQVGAETLGLDPSAVTFSGMNPVAAGAGRYLSGVVHHVRANLLGDDMVMASPLVRDDVFRQIAAAFLLTFPNTTHTVETSDGQSDAEPAAIRRAVEFIDANAHRPISLADIAAAARLGPRGLQAGFRRHRDSTPLEYLRRVRMDGAHRDLQKADPTRGDTVGEIAARWGFSNPGRFSMEYRQRYHRSPSHTLRA